jgi:hypothetical protein
MSSEQSMLAKLEAALGDTSDVYIGKDVDEKTYIKDLTDSIHTSTCAPFPVTATVMPPGFPDTAIGSTVSGFCLAKQAGYWLVYQPAEDRFLCFWGDDQNHLGAHGVVGSPLYCWSA